MKKLLAVSLAIVMALSISACKSNDKDNKKEDANTVSKSDYKGSLVLSEVPKPTKDPLEKYEPAITVSTIHNANDGAFWFPDGESIENNVYTKRYEEQLGIKYQFKWTCPGSQMTEKMNTMFTSGDLPDVMAVTREQFEKLYAAGLLQDITVPLIEYASEFTRQHLTGEFEGLLNAVTKDGKYYGIPNGFSYKDGGDMMWLRKDWMDKLGLAIPKTTQDLDAILEAFKTKDPDGNGKADTYGIALSAASQQPWEWTLNTAFFNMYNSYPNTWYKNSKGEIENGMFGAESKERTRQAILKASEYYKKGYISKDFATMDFDMRNQDIFNGKSGVVYGDVWGAYWPLFMHKDVDAKADWIPVPVVSGTNETAKIARNDVDVTGVLVATKNCKNPEALVKMTNLYHGLNNDPKTMEFEKFNTNSADNNQIFLAYPLQIYNPSFNYEGFQQISAAQETGKTDTLCPAYKAFYDQAIKYEKTGDKSGFAAYRSYLKEQSSLSVIDTYIKDKRIVFNEYTAEPTPFMIENAPTVKKMYDEMIIKVITGKSDIKEYDKFLATWGEIYGTQATKEVNDFFTAKGSKSIQDKMSGK